jgi:hypothetical protein
VLIGGVETPEGPSSAGLFRAHIRLAFLKLFTSVSVLYLGIPSAARIADCGLQRLAYPTIYLLFHINKGTSLLFTWYYYVISHARLSRIIARYMNIHYKPYKLTECSEFSIEGIGLNYS